MKALDELKRQIQDRNVAFELLLAFCDRAYSENNLAALESTLKAIDKAFYSHRFRYL